MNKLDEDIARRRAERNRTLEATFVCVACGGKPEHAERIYNKKWCSEACHRAHRPSRPKPLLSRGTVGAISELAVAADLMRRGYEVFRALSPNSSCDLVAVADGRLMRIEVRTAYRLKSGALGCAWDAGDVGRSDVLALVTQDGLRVEFRPELPDQRKGRQ